MAWAQTKTTRHTCGGPVFGRKTKGCPRCDELTNGADVVTWNITDRRKLRDQDRRWRLEHDCAKSRCGPVCTFGDW
jgi:hypothetical protein